jgi:uncharacterized membrane protein YjfL (UPF0719 family)
MIQIAHTSTLEHRRFLAMTISRYLLGTLVFALLATFSLANARTSTQMIEGAVDVLTVEGNDLTARGWAASVDPQQSVSSLVVRLAGDVIYDGTFERIARPDVVKATGRGDWSKSGWHLIVNLPDSVQDGEYPVTIHVKLSDGKEALITAPPQHGKIKISGRWQEPAYLPYLLKAAIIFILAFLVAAYFGADRISRTLSSKFHIKISAPGFFCSAIMLGFCFLVALGSSGSSMRIGFQQAPFIKATTINIFGKERPIRSDEWLVLTPMAMGQFNHSPKYPTVNSNLGEDGHNMLVVGMSGVPVNNISSLAKPATWGFFLFDLRRALSWHWNFPFFACLLALWGVISLLSPHNWRFNFLISLFFCISPYITAWSNWPAYAVFFPSVSLVLGAAILRSDRRYLPLIFGCLLGISLAGFVLILYPPWQVSLGYVFLLLTTGVMIRDKLHRRFSTVKVFAFLIALTVGSLLLWAWWKDAKPAVQAMQNTLYPGQRTMIVGGNYSISELLRGFTNLTTLYKIDPSYSNQSEVSSFYYLLLPLFGLFLLRLKEKSVDAVEFALAAGIGMILCFQFIGFPEAVAKYTQWGRVQPKRADLALGVATTILSGALLSSGARSRPISIPIKTLSATVAVAWAIVVYYSFSQLPPGVLSSIPTGAFCVALLYCVAGGYFLMTRRSKLFAWSSLAISLATTLAFNPISQAPEKMTVDIGPNSNHITPEPTGPGRTLVLGTQVPAMYLLASGLPVANGIFYYPQESLWKRFDADGSKSKIYNRYQHVLIFDGAAGEETHFQLESPQPDVVKITLDFKKFNFNMTGAQNVLAPERDDRILLINPSLSPLGKIQGWSWFKIKQSPSAEGKLEDVTSD